MVPMAYPLILSALLFTTGVVGVMIRRNSIMLFMCIEMMLNAANIAFVGFARHFGQLNGQVIVLFVIAVAAAEVAIGLALIVVVFRTHQTTDIDDLHNLNR